MDGEDYKKFYQEIKAEIMKFLLCKSYDVILLE